MISAKPALINQCFSLLFLRWNSTYDLLFSIDRLKPALVQTLSNVPDAPIELTNQDWKLIKKVIRVLKPFKEATEWLSHHDASISMVIPIVTTITVSLEEEDPEDDHGVLGMKRGLKAAMATRFDGIENKEYYAMASLLDTKFKRHFFMEETTFDRTKASLVNQLVQALRGQPGAQVYFM